MLRLTFRRYLEPEPKTFQINILRILRYLGTTPETFQIDAPSLHFVNIWGQDQELTKLMLQSIDTWIQRR